MAESGWPIGRNQRHKVVGDRRNAMQPAPHLRLDVRMSGGIRIVLGIAPHTLIINYQ